MTWESRIPGAPDTSKIILAPLMMCLRDRDWGALLDGAVDSYTSDPVTLDLLADLIRHLDAQVVVEVGTYRGWGTFTMAEALRLNESTGHLWTCDPVDYEIQEVLDKMGLASYVTYHQGPLETLLPLLPEQPIDLAYIDASDVNEENLRLRYLSLLLPRVKVGGLIAMDDVDHGWQGAEVMKQLGVVLPGHRGLALMQKR